MTIFMPRANIPRHRHPCKSKTLPGFPRGSTVEAKHDTVVCAAEQEAVVAILMLSTGKCANVHDRMQVQQDGYGNARTEQQSIEVCRTRASCGCERSSTSNQILNAQYWRKVRAKSKAQSHYAIYQKIVARGEDTNSTTQRLHNERIDRNWTVGSSHLEERSARIESCWMHKHAKHAAFRSKKNGENSGKASPNELSLPRHAGAPPRCAMCPAPFFSP